MCVFSLPSFDCPKKNAFNLSNSSEITHSGCRRTPVELEFARVVGVDESGAATERHDANCSDAPRMHKSACGQVVPTSHFHRAPHSTTPCTKHMRSEQKRKFVRSSGLDPPRRRPHETDPPHPPRFNRRCNSNASAQDVGRDAASDDTNPLWTKLESALREGCIQRRTIRHSSGHVAIECVTHGPNVSTPQHFRDTNVLLKATGHVWNANEKWWVRVSHISPDATVFQLLCFGVIEYTETESHLMATKGHMMPHEAMRHLVANRPPLVGTKYRIPQKDIAGLLVWKNVCSQRRHSLTSNYSEALVLLRPTRIDSDDSKGSDASLPGRRAQYGQLLLSMSASGSYGLGKDGGINWPDPPVAWESGITSRATEYRATFHHQ
jgi:hypothetical protein